MSMVQRLKGDHKTFAEIADPVMTTILREGPTSKRVDVAFDVYRKMSIENTQREKRGGYTGTECRNIQPDHKIQQSRKYLSNPQNKKQFVRVVTDERQKERFRQRLTEKHLFTTAEEHCVEVSTDHDRPREDPTSTQEGADTRLLLHAFHASREWFQGCCYVRYRCICTLSGI